MRTGSCTEYRITQILAKGSLLRGSLFHVKRLENKIGKPRFVIIVSKKTSAKAVERNRIKRRVREALRMIIKEKNALHAQSRDMLKNDVIQGNKELTTEPYYPVRRVGSDEVDDVGRVFQHIPQMRGFDFAIITKSTCLTVPYTALLNELKYLIKI